MICVNNEYVPYLCISKSVLLRRRKIRLLFDEILFQNEKITRGLHLRCIRGYDARRDQDTRVYSNRCAISRRYASRSPGLFMTRQTRNENTCDVVMSLSERAWFFYIGLKA